MDIEDNVGFTVAGCCAMMHIQGFWWDDSEKSKEFNVKKKKEIVAFLNEALDHGREEGKSIAFATVCNEQLLAEEALIEAGFTSSFPNWSYRDSSYSNYETGVKVYMKQLYNPEGNT